MSTPTTVCQKIGYSFEGEKPANYRGSMCDPCTGQEECCKWIDIPRLNCEEENYCCPHPSGAILAHLSGYYRHDSNSAGQHISGDYAGSIGGYKTNENIDYIELGFVSMVDDSGWEYLSEWPHAAVGVNMFVAKVGTLMSGIRDFCNDTSKSGWANQIKIAPDSQNPNDFTSVLTILSGDSHENLSPPAWPNSNFEGNEYYEPIIQGGVEVRNSNDFGWTQTTRTFDSYFFCTDGTNFKRLGTGVRDGGDTSFTKGRKFDASSTSSTNPLTGQWPLHYVPSRADCSGITTQTNGVYDTGAHGFVLYDPNKISTLNNPSWEWSRTNIIGWTGQTGIINDTYTYNAFTPKSLSLWHPTNASRNYPWPEINSGEWNDPRTKGAIYYNIDCDDDGPNEQSVDSSSRVGASQKSALDLVNAWIKSELGDEWRIARANEIFPDFPTPKNECRQILTHTGEENRIQFGNTGKFHAWEWDFTSEDRTPYEGPGLMGFYESTSLSTPNNSTPWLLNDSASVGIFGYAFRGFEGCGVNSGWSGIYLYEGKSTWDANYSARLGHTGNFDSGNVSGFTGVGLESHVFKITTFSDWCIKHGCTSASGPFLTMYPPESPFFNEFPPLVDSNKAACKNCNYSLTGFRDSVNVKIYTDSLPCRNQEYLNSIAYKGGISNVQGSDESSSSYQERRYSAYYSGGNLNNNLIMENSLSREFDSREFVITDTSPLTGIYSSAVKDERDDQNITTNFGWISDPEEFYGIDSGEYSLSRCCSGDKQASSAIVSGIGVTYPEGMSGIPCKRMVSGEYCYSGGAVTVDLGTATGKIEAVVNGNLYWGDVEQTGTTDDLVSGDRNPNYNFGYGLIYPKGTDGNVTSILSGSTDAGSSRYLRYLEKTSTNSEEAVFAWALKVKTGTSVQKGMGLITCPGSTGDSNCYSQGGLIKNDEEGVVDSNVWGEGGKTYLPYMYNPSGSCLGDCIVKTGVKICYLDNGSSGYRGFSTMAEACQTGCQSGDFTGWVIERPKKKRGYEVIDGDKVPKISTLIYSGKGPKEDDPVKISGSNDFFYIESNKYIKINSSGYVTASGACSETINEKLEFTMGGYGPDWISSSQPCEFPSAVEFIGLFEFTGNGLEVEIQAQANTACTFHMPSVGQKIRSADITSFAGLASNAGATLDGEFYYGINCSDAPEYVGYYIKVDLDSTVGTGLVLETGKCPSLSPRQEISVVYPSWTNLNGEVAGWPSWGTACSYAFSGSNNPHSEFGYWDSLISDKAYVTGYELIDQGTFGPKAIGSSNIIWSHDTDNVKFDNSQSGLVYLIIGPSSTGYFRMSTNGSFTNLTGSC